MASAIECFPMQRSSAASLFGAYSVLASRFCAVSSLFLRMCFLSVAAQGFVFIYVFVFVCPHLCHLLPSRHAAWYCDAVSSLHCQHRPLRIIITRLARAAHALLMHSTTSAQYASMASSFRVWAFHCRSHSYCMLALAVVSASSQLVNLSSSACSVFVPAIF